MSRKPLFPHNLGRIDEFARGRDDVHVGHHIAQPRLSSARRYALNLEGQLRQTVSERLQWQILKHDIGRPAIGRCLALGHLDQRVWLLRLIAGIDPVHHARQVKRLAIRPDPPHAEDRPLAQRHGKADRIIILGDLRPTLAARPPRRLRLLEAGRPDHLTANPHPAIDRGQARPLARLHHRQGFDAWPFLRLHVEPRQPAIIAAAQISPPGRAARILVCGLPVACLRPGHLQAQRFEPPVNARQPLIRQRIACAPGFDLGKRGIIRLGIGGKGGHQFGIAAARHLGFLGHVVSIPLKSIILRRRSG